jgi:cytochrome c-type biogenesis protein CcmF
VGAALSLFLALWVILVIAQDFWQKLDGRLSRLRKLSASYWGMQIAHTGLAICALGIGLSTVYDQSKELRMVPGDSAQVAAYRFDLVDINQHPGPNYLAYRGEVQVYRQNQLVTVLFPEKRSYNAGGQVMTEAAIDASLTRDIYVSLGEPLPGGAWAVSLQVKPFVRCIWLGGLLLALGGLLAAGDRRYRRSRAKTQAVSPTSEVVSA